MRHIKGKKALIDMLFRDLWSLRDWGSCGCSVMLLCSNELLSRTVFFQSLPIMIDHDWHWFENATKIQS